jgi:DnaB-like helicase N terminal domain/AAA domain
MKDNEKKKIPPNSKESEMMVLGCMLTSINGLNIGADGLNDADFYYTEHKDIFRVLQAAYENKKPADVHLVCEELKRLEKLNSVGGAAYIMTVAQYAGTSAYLEEYVSIVRDKAILREMIHVSQSILKAALEDPKDIKKLLIYAKQQFENLEKNEIKNNFQLKFVSELDPDYFHKTPPEKPRLLYIHDKNGIKATFLHKEIVGMLVAEGGRGKTHLLAQLALCVATGIPFLNEILVEKPGHVCFIVGENDNDDIRRLFFKIKKHLKNLVEENEKRNDGKHFKTHSEDPLVTIPERLLPLSVHGLNAHFVDNHGERTPFFYSFLKALKEKEPKEGFQLIIFDPASRFAGTEAEKDNAIATSFIASLEAISDELKGRPTIILSHHKSKQAFNNQNAPSQADARGASGLTDGVRWQAGLNKKKDEEEFSILEVTKTNFTKKMGRLETKKNDQGIHIFKNWESEKKDEKKEEPKPHVI